ncbi:Major Facilitator Superfamily protein [Caprobacter fermentans]|uniref:Major Facilitator Superfamily protein n=1 Tax=Caproicibacter fermentans TaxID=2576756 RepID=A0A6N8HZP8_9FIRM|nr:MFS transporter [Caproicibacter fermentans]MVB11000.1 Major Facilitator Superfamily protein [Caproicibacter fermentans]
MRSFQSHIYFVIVLLQGMVFYAPAAGLYRVERGLSVFDITLIESISLIVMIALEIPMGFLAERIGYRKTIFFCNILFFLSKLVFWRADGCALFLVERMMLSVVCAGLSGCDSAYLFACAGETDSAAAFSRYHALTTLGIVAAALVFTFGIGGNLDLSAELTAVVYGAAALLSFFLPEVEVPRAEHAPMRQTVRFLRLRGGETLRFLPYLAACALLTQTAQTVSVFLSQLQYLRCGIATETMGLCYLAVQGAALSSAFSHRLSARLGETAFSSALFVAAAVSCAVLAVTRSAVLSVACVAALSAAAALLGPSVMTVQNRQPGASFARAAVLSVYSMGTDGFSAGVNAAIGKAADGGLGRAFLCSAAFCAAGLGLYLFWARYVGTGDGRFTGGPDECSERT